MTCHSRAYVNEVSVNMTNHFKDNDDNRLRLHHSSSAIINITEVEEVTPCIF